MAAALLLHLILDVHRSRPRLDHGTDGARDVEGTAPAGVYVHQHRKVSDVGDSPHVGQNVLHGRNAKVRNAAGARRHTPARDVERLESRGLRQAGVKGIDGPNALQRLLLLDGGAEVGTG